MDVLSAHRGKAVDLLRMGGLLNPMRPVPLHLLRPLQCVVLVPAAVGVEHESRVVAERLPQNATNSTFFRIPSGPEPGPYPMNHFWYR